MRDFDAVVYHPRIRRTRDEQQPVLERIFGYELAKQGHYSDVDPLEALDAFADARRATLATIRGLSEAQLQRTADLAQYGVITLGGLVHLLCDHDLRHLACMHWLSGKMACQQP